MGRPATIKLRTTAISGFHAAFRLAIKQDPIPHDVELLRLIVSCLLKRMRALDRVQARHAEEWIATMYAHDVLERFFPAKSRTVLFSPDRDIQAKVFEAMRSLLSAIHKNPAVLCAVSALPSARGLAPASERLAWAAELLAAPRINRASGRRHWKATVEWQRDRLLEWCHVYPYPAGQISKRWPWVQLHGRTIWSLLTTVSCRCEYQASVDGLGRESVDGCLTTGQLVLALLAHLHGTNTHYIHKIVNPSKRSR